MPFSLSHLFSASDYISSDPANADSYECAIQDFLFLTLFPGPLSLPLPAALIYIFLCCYVLAALPASELLFMKSGSTESCVVEGTKILEITVAHTHYINYSIAAQ
jgi:hypothetical protein